MAQAQQLLQSVQGSVGYGTVAGAPTPAAVAAMGGIRAPDPTQAAGGSYTAAPGSGTTGRASYTGSAPPPTYNTGGNTATSWNQPNQPSDDDPSSPRQKKSPGFANKMGGIFGYFGRSILVRGAFSAIGAVSDAAQQQQQLSDMNRRAGEGTQQWRQFEDQILKVGVGLGQTRQQMIELTNTFISSVGRMGTEQAAQTIRGGITLAKTMGIAPESVVGFESNTARFLQGPGTDFAKLDRTLYGAVQKGMQGREEEVIKAINELTDMVGARLPDFGPEGIGGIAQVLGALSSTGVQGFMGERGAKVAGGIDQFISGQGSAAQNMIAWSVAARYRQNNGLGTSVYDTALQMEGGIKDQRNRAGFADFAASLPKGPMGALMLQGAMGGSLNQAAELLKSGAIPNMTGTDLADKTTIPGYEQTQPDKNTEAMVSAGRAMQELGEKLVGIVAPAMDILAHNIGLLTAVMVASNMTGGIGGLKTVGQAGGGALAAGGIGGIGVAAGIGLGIGGLGSLLFDKIAHPGEPTTLDMLLQNMGMNFLPGQATRPTKRAKGGIITSPEYALLGESGPEAVIPLNGEGIGKMMSSMLGGTGDSWKAFAAQFGIETAWGSQMYGNNPFNLRPIKGGWGGQIGVHHSGQSGDFAAFGSIEDGIRAAANNYLVGNYGYDAVVAAARSGDAGAVARAIQNSSWDAGHYGYSSLTNMVGGGMGGASNAVGGGAVQHDLNVTIKQPDGSMDKFKRSLTDRTALTSPNWGVGY